MVDDVLKVGVLCVVCCCLRFVISFRLIKVNNRGMHNITFRCEVCLSVIFLAHTK